MITLYAGNEAINRAVVMAVRNYMEEESSYICKCHKNNNREVLDAGSLMDFPQDFRHMMFDTRCFLACMTPKEIDIAVAVAIATIRRIDNQFAELYTE